MGTFVGIDLGTTYSAAARIGADGKPVVVRNAEGSATTPSVIWFGSDPPTVGQAAKDEQRAGATDVAAFFKRSMGDPNFQLTFNGRDYGPVDLSTLVLKKVKADCEAALGGPVTHAVITVPAYFNNSQREATIEAGHRAGLIVPRIINEPTAAALVYGMHQSPTSETCVVYDLGGGTFDVTIVRITANEITVLATDGDHMLGGRDWDDCVARAIAAHFQDDHGVDPLARPEQMQDLLVACEKAKWGLSKLNSVKVGISVDGVSESYDLSRERFEALTADLMQRTQHLTELTLAAAGLEWREITSVLLVGGSTRMPMVHRYIEQMSGKPPKATENVDEVVALGAAIQAAIDIQPVDKPKMMLPGARRIQDVMSHSLGVVLESPDRSRYVNDRIIKKNSPIPAAKKRLTGLRTRAKGDNVLDVYVTQGESDDPTQCALLGKYRFTNITHASKEPAAIDISYAYDQNGVVAVSATEKSTGKQLPMEVQPLPTDMSWLSQPPPEIPPPPSLTVYLAFDLSGSMSGEPLAESQRAAHEFVRQIGLESHSIGLISFADSCDTTVTACQDGRKLARGIDGMTIGAVGGGNATNPFGHAHRLLEQVKDPRCIVVLTDGAWSDQPKAAREAKACHADGIEIIAVGFGGADENFLDGISTTSLGSFSTNLAGLVETFSSIAQQLNEGVASGSLLRKG